jgi:transglutaminase-like putative cysteine protease
VSAIPLVTPGDLPATRDAATARPKVWIRVLAFSALSLYGVQRWGRLLAHPPGWRLVGLALVAITLAAIVPLVRHLAAGWPARVGQIVSGLLIAALMLSALPIAGLRWEWVWHARVAVSARAIGNGLNSLAAVLVPYLGHAYSTRLVIMLGAGILLLDAAAAFAFTSASPAEIGDGRRAAAALPLLALAIVPATLVPPAHPAVEGFILFVLTALLVWGERIQYASRAAAAGVACAAAIAGAFIGPIIEQRHAWVDYRAWAGTVTRSDAASFDWNQTYGPLRWPQDGRIVLVVHAAHGDYWKAQDLTAFNGTAWTAGNTARPVAGILRSAPPLPSPSRAARRRYTETIQVTIDALQTTDVIGGSGLTSRPQVAGGAHGGAAPGTWVAHRALVPGDAYTVRTYSPSPSARSLARASERSYPWAALQSDLTLALPLTGGGSTTLPFPGFHHVDRLVGEQLNRSPYAQAYALAHRLAASSASPYAFVKKVKSYLDSGRFRYDQDTPRSRYPLLRFLFDTHAGYCQQFSGTMALLLRMGGVPARVAAGFTSGSFDPGARTWTVTDTDAHAWVEVWFPAYGWVKFDPTPASAPARSGIPPAGADEHLPALAAGAHASVPQTKRGQTTTTGTTHSHRSKRHASGAGAGWPWLLGAALAVALVLAGAWRALITAARRDPLAELERALARTGRPLAPGTTLVALERRFHDSPQAAEYVRTLRLARYAGVSVAPSGAGRRAVRGELSSGLGLAGRLRALWALPPRLPAFYH